MNGSFDDVIRAAAFAAMLKKENQESRKINVMSFEITASALGINCATTGNKMFAQAFGLEDTIKEVSSDVSEIASKYGHIVAEKIREKLAGAGIDTTVEETPDYIMDIVNRTYDT